MSWFKNAIRFNWEEGVPYHLSRVMEFEIDNFPRLTINKNKKSPETLSKIGFYIIRDDGKEYHFVLEGKGDKLKTYIGIEGTGNFVPSNLYNISKSSPLQIIENGLMAINNDLSNNFNGRSENELV